MIRIDIDVGADRMNRHKQSVQPIKPIRSPRERTLIELGYGGSSLAERELAQDIKA